MSVAVATAMPTTSAAAVNTLRRGLRTKDSPTRRANIASGVNLGGGVAQRRKVHDHFASFNARFHADGIAAARLADRRYINRRAAIPADHALAFLAVTGSAANLAGIQRHGVIAILFMNHKKANHGAVHLGLVEMQAGIGKIGKRDANLLSWAISVFAGEGAAAHPPVDVIPGEAKHHARRTKSPRRSSSGAGDGIRIRACAARRDWRRHPRPAASR